MPITFMPEEIIETIQMVRAENLDIRTITLGISLRDCVASEIKIVARKIYDKITSKAERLVRTGEDISEEFGIPIINKRIAVTPIALVGEGCTDTEDYLALALAMDRAAKEVGVNFIGGFSWSR